MSKIPSRWLPYVLDAASRPGPHQARAEQLVQGHQASRARKLARTLPRRKAASADRAERVGATRAVRGAVVSRAGGRCEACGVEVTSRAGELDHFFGRARAETSETCWLLCAACHFGKTNSLPSRVSWLNRFRRHAERLGAGRALQLVDQQLALDTLAGGSP